jgi:3-methyladenine DNA glycosylase Mpg
MGRADALKPSRHKGAHPPLPRADLPVDTVSLARYLIGKILVREIAEGVAGGRIVEVRIRSPVYSAGDPVSLHELFGRRRTRRTFRPRSNVR